MEAVLPDIEALARFADDLGRRVARDGLDGVAAVLELHGRLRALLQTIPSDDLRRASEAVTELIAHCERIAAALGTLARAKTIVGP